MSQAHILYTHIVNIALAKDSSSMLMMMIYRMCTANSFLLILHDESSGTTLAGMKMDGRMSKKQTF